MELSRSLIDLVEAGFDITAVLTDGGDLGAGVVDGLVGVLGGALRAVATPERRAGQPVVGGPHRRPQVGAELFVKRNDMVLVGLPRFPRRRGR